MKVYFGGSTLIAGQYKYQDKKIFNLAKKPLVPLSKYLREISNPGNLQICSAFKEDWSNTYIDNCPTDILANFTDSGELEFNSSGAVIGRQPNAFKNRISFDLSYCYLFFAEEELTLTVLPTIFHKTDIAKNAVLTSASYDISKWFRPIHPSFHLWEDLKDVNIKENEPIMYLQFRTNKKIELVEFEVTDKIWEYATSCAAHSRIKPFRSLENRYLDFKNANFNKQILKEIKNNII